MQRVNGPPFPAENAALEVGSPPLILVSDYGGMSHGQAFV